MQYGLDVGNSILASIGKTISWIFYPMLGANSWGAAVSALQGLVAKEQVISSMSVIAGIAEDNVGSQIFAEGNIFSFFTTSSAYAFMVFNLFCAPCIGAIGAMKRELGGTREMLKAVMFHTIFAWILATIVYQIGSRIENGTFNFVNLFIITLIVGIIIFILKDSKKIKEECGDCPYSKSCDKNVKV